MYEEEDEELSNKPLKISDESVPLEISNILDETEDINLSEQSDIQTNSGSEIKTENNNTTNSRDENGVTVENKVTDENGVTDKNGVTVENGETTLSPIYINDTGKGFGDVNYLQLGDIIKATSTNEQYDNKIFYIDYIGTPKIIVIEKDTLDKFTWNFQNGIIENGEITQINILKREDTPSYAKQNLLLPYAWVDIVFTDMSTSPGQIMSLEEDMIEVKMYPAELSIYINFDYKGIPDDLGIVDIKLRNAPYSSEIEKEVPQEYVFMEDDVAPIQVFLEGDERQFTYSIEEQTNDMLEVLLSKIPTAKRNESVLNRINKLIVRFKQLYEKHTVFDKYNNITKNDKKFKTKTNNWKPLSKVLLELNRNLYWVMMVGKYNNKLLVGDDLINSILRIEAEIDIYNNDAVSLDQSRYIELYRKINKDFTPFEEIDRDELKNIIYKHQVGTDLQVINNNDNFKTNTYAGKQYFYSQRFNTGLKYITQPKSINNIKSIFHSLTDSDMLYIRSIMTLPKDFIQFSKVNLPETNILRRSNLGTNFINYWRLLKNPLRVKNTFISDFNYPLILNEESHFQKIKNYELELPEGEEYSQVDKYMKYLNHIIPTTKTLFNLFKQNISGKLSFKDVVDELEPFMIYPEDITYQQYKEINKYINNLENGQIKSYVEKYTKYKTAFSKIQNTFIPASNNKNAFADYKKQKFNNMTDLIDDKLMVPGIGTPVRNDIVENYFYKTPPEYNIKITNSEYLKEMIEKDFGVNFNTAVLLSNNSLLSPENILTTINQDKEGLVQPIDNPCKNYIIAKKYKSNHDLEIDNGIENVYFDKEYDDMNYDILEEIQEEFFKKNLSFDKTKQNEEFQKFLIDKLKKIYKFNEGKVPYFNEDDIPYVVESLTNKSKKVLDGHYAFIMAEGSETKFFVRKGNEWVYDEDVPKNMIEPAQLCNNQPMCVYKKESVGSTCTNTDNISNNNEKELLNNMVNEIETQYEESMSQFKENTEKKYDTSVLNLIYNVNKIFMSKMDKYKVSIGDTLLDKSITVSPYVKYLDVILANTNFVEKQGLLITFQNVCTREPETNNLDILTGEPEDTNWFYCKKTDVKLLPRFLYDLAVAYRNGTYNQKMDSIIQTNGTLSDDGDKWIDKYSGRVIKMIDFSVEEEFNDEGFRVIARDILEEDVQINTHAINNDVKKYITNESKIINTIIQALSTNMKFDISKYHDFIISKISDLYKDPDIVPSETDYNKKIQEKMDKDVKKDKKEKYETYEEFINKSILYLTIGCVLIATQISVPSIKTKYTFPGCVKSFSGYPTLGDGDMSALKYFACVTLKLKVDYFPWKMLPSMKSKDKSLEKIEENIKKYVDNFLIEDSEIVALIQEKQRYLSEIQNMQMDEDNEHTISAWNAFLPAIKPFHIQRVLNVSEEFESRLIKHLKLGSNEQQDEIFVIQSKIILFSFAIQELIFKTISTEKLLMKNSNENYTVENSCCNNINENITLQYFIKQQSDIEVYNNIIHNFSIFLNDIRILTTAPIFLSIEKTKMKTFILPNSFNEKTIFLAFVKYCNFKNDFPNSDEINGICGNKPDYIRASDTINEIMSKLKMDNRNYNEEQLLRLLQVINQKHIMPKEQTSKTNTPNEVITELIEQENDNNIMSPNILTLFNNYLQVYNIYDKHPDALSEIENLNRALVNSNNSIRKEIIDFVKKYTQKSGKEIGEFLEKITKYKVNDNYNEYNMMNFMKNCISQLGSIFPSMIRNNANHNIESRKYWGITSTHINNISRISIDEFESINKYYGNEELTDLLEGIESNTKYIIEFTDKIPVVQKSSFKMETSIWMMEHCLLVVLLEYKRLSENMGRREEEEGPRLYNDNTQFKKLIASLMKDCFKILIQTKEKISISYEEIMDNIFKLKEAEKNRIRQRAENMTEEKRKIDNEFKVLRIGEWGKGENVTGYDGERYDEEFQIMTELNEKVRQKMRGNVAFLDNDDAMEDLMMQEFIDEEEGYTDEREQDYDDGDYYNEDE